MKINKKYEILTPTGFQSFAGVTKKTATTSIKFSFDDLSNITVTPDHRFVENGKEISANNLKLGDSLSGKTIFEIETILGKIEVYDPVNVADGNLYVSEGVVSHNCDFLGSSSTLVSGTFLSRIPTIAPVFTNNDLDVFLEPISNHSYIAFVDVSRGLSGDYSALTVIDITSIPYQVVAKYKSNEITPLFFPSVIKRICEDYNDACVLIELNDAGEQVANILYNDLQYENLIFTYTENSKQFPSLTDGKSYKPGVKTSKTTKSVGCSQLKILIEENKLVINDAEILSELSTFVEQKGSYGADSGYHDDLVMTLVLFGWLTSTEMFKFLGNESLRSNIYSAREQSIKDSMTPYGFRDDGVSNPLYKDSDGYTWQAKGDIETRDDIVNKIRSDYAFDEDFGKWFHN